MEKNEKILAKFNNRHAFIQKYKRQIYLQKFYYTYTPIKNFVL